MTPQDADATCPPQIKIAPAPHSFADTLPIAAAAHESRAAALVRGTDAAQRSEEHTSELQSLMRISYAVFCLKKTKQSIFISFYSTTSIATLSTLLYTPLSRNNTLQCVLSPN